MLARQRLLDFCYNARPTRQLLPLRLRNSTFAMSMPSAHFYQIPNRKERHFLLCPGVLINSQALPYHFSPFFEVY